MKNYFIAMVVFLVFAVVVIGGTDRPTAHANSKMSLGGPLQLADEGIFFVNGKLISSDYPLAPDSGKLQPGSYVVNQMYVHYRIPVELKHKYPIVMIHGNGLTGATYETTPDGREGWATYFTRKGFAVYVVDHPGRGRSGFDPSLINQTKLGAADLSKVSDGIQRYTMELSWEIFRFGPKAGIPYPNTQFPIEAASDFSAQGVPGAERFLEGGSFGTAPQAIVALLDKIGPAIIMVHSQSGPFADMVVGMRPNLVKGVINVEGNQLTIPTDAQVAAYRNVPDLELFGDHVIGNPVRTGQPRYDGRKAVAERIIKAGGKADVVVLPDIGIYGNSHMMMQDKNNLQVADFIIKWIKKIKYSKTKNL